MINDAICMKFSLTLKLKNQIMFKLIKTFNMIENHEKKIKFLKIDDERKYRKIISI